MSVPSLSLRRNPFRLLLSAAPWASAGYLTGYLFTGTALFCVALTAAITGVAFSFTLIGLPLLVAVAVTVRWCADAERFRLRTICAGPVRGRYREPGRPGVLAQLRTRWGDPATWCDLALLLGLYPPLFALDTAALTVWLTLLAGVTLPAWYQYPEQTWTVGFNGGGSGSAHGVQLGYFPRGPHGPGAWGVYVDTLPKAIAAAAACLILFLLFNYALVAAARLHAATTRALLRASDDPLKEAKEVLAQPGPLRRFIQNGPAAPPGTPGSPPAGPPQPAGHG